MAYNYQTWSFEESVTSTKLQQTEDNIRDHIHGRASVAKTGVSFPNTDKTGTFTAVAGENGEMFHCDGTFTIDLTAAATLGAGWCIGVTNDGSGTITIDPDGAELIDGVANIIISANGSKLVYCNGASFFTIGGGGSLVQEVYTIVTSSSTGTTRMNNDETVPQQSSDGDLYMSRAITPTDAANILEIVVTIPAITPAVADGRVGAALFQDATEATLATGIGYAEQGGAREANIVFTHLMAAGTTSSTTFKVHCGSNTAGTTTFNTLSYGTTTPCSIVIREYVP